MAAYNHTNDVLTSFSLEKCESFGGMNGATIHSFDVPTLKTLAASYRHTARRLETRAHELELREKRHTETRHRLNALAALPALVREQIEIGNDLDYALRNTAKVSGAPLETIQAYWSQWLKSRDDQIKNERQIMIMRMARDGLHNYQISEKTGIPDYTISKVISKAKRKGR